MPLGESRAQGGRRGLAVDADLERVVLVAVAELERAEDPESAAVVLEGGRDLADEALELALDPRPVHLVEARETRADVVDCKLRQAAAERREGG